MPLSTILPFEISRNNTTKTNLIAFFNLKLKIENKKMEILSNN